MTTRNFFWSFLFALICLLTFLQFSNDKHKKSLRNINTNDHDNYIAVNECLMWVSNNGDGSHNPYTDGSGFYWPINEDTNLTAIFEDGLVWGGIVDNEVRFNGNTHRQGLQAGKILIDGTADDPDLEKYRVYRIRRGWEELPDGAERAAFEKDYNEWPVEDGAPWIDIDGDGIFTRGEDEPEIIGDETLWYVANDLDPSRTTFTYGTLPISLEFQTTIFAFNDTNYLANVVFKKYKIINKGNNTVNEMYLGYWSDPDLGNMSDDYIGCDENLNLAYCYNADEFDEKSIRFKGYGSPPPAVGYRILQGPIIQSNLNDSARFDNNWIRGYKNLPMNAFYGFNLIPFPIPNYYAKEYYNFLKGFAWDGSPIINPNTSQPTTFVLSGNPVAGNGWYEGEGWPGGPPPGDRRMLMSTGSFTLAPGDTQEVVIGILIERGLDRLNSITKLKNSSRMLQNFYNRGFKNIKPVPIPTLRAFENDKSITLWWEPNAENYNEPDYSLYNTGSGYKKYLFEGYRVWQYEDEFGTNPRLIEISDIDNLLTAIKSINEFNEITTIFVSPDSGVHRFLTIDKDYYSETNLLNGKDYYFGITAYAYSDKSYPPFLESEPQIIKVTPTRPTIDYSLYFNPEEELLT